MENNHSSELALKYIRDRYQVPAYVGMKIVYKNIHEGEIIGGDRAYLRIKFDNPAFDGIYHPTWEIKYICD